MTSVSAPPSPPSDRRLRLTLMASLAVNVLIIGAVAGTLLMARHHGWKGHHRKPPGLLGFAQTLPMDRGEMIRQKVAGEQAAIEPLRQAERDARSKARAILLEDPFDAEKFRAALVLSAEAGTKEKIARMSLVASTAAQLTPEERRQLFDWFEKRHRARQQQQQDEVPPPPR